VAERRRRTYGEGALYQIADGRWQGSVELGWIDGARRRRTITRRTKAEVARELRRLLTEAEAGRLNFEQAPLMKNWLSTYFRDVASSRVRHATLHGYEQLARLYVNPHLGEHRIDRIRPQHLVALYRRLSETLAPSSVRRVHAVLRRALTVAVRWGIIHTNPAQLVDPPSMQTKTVQPYTVREARVLLKAATDDRLEARWVIAVSLGLRQGEVLGLGWQHIDFARRLITVERALQRQPGGNLALQPTKTARSNRVVPMPDAVADALERRRRLQLADRDLVGDGWPGSDLVFTTQLGTPIHPRNDYRAFQALVRRAGIRRVRLHDLRHTSASLLLAQGVPARVVMEILGHSQISVTMNTYTHVDPELSRDATERIARLFWPDQEARNQRNG
jgi:integrase